MAAKTTSRAERRALVAAVRIVPRGQPLGRALGEAGPVRALRPRRWRAEAVDAPDAHERAMRAADRIGHWLAVFNEREGRETVITARSVVSGKRPLLVAVAPRRRPTTGVQRPLDAQQRMLFAADRLGRALADSWRDA